MEQYWILVALSWGCLVAAQTPPDSTTNSTNSTNAPNATTTPSSVEHALKIRIVNGENGTNYISGRVEVSNDNGAEWGTVCDDAFNKSAAIVVCRSAGYEDGEAIAKAYFGSGVGSVSLDQIECRGWESSLDHCNKNPWRDHDCDHSEDVGVYCYNSSDGVFKTQLVEGSYSPLLNTKWGRLEVKLGKMKWGSVCDDMFNQGAAAITCRGFDYMYGQMVTHESFQEGKRTYLDEVNCRGSETSLLQCRHNPWRTHDCGREEDIGVVCFNTSVRLRSDSLSIRNVGVVELWVAGDGWMEVCDGGWSYQDARVTCRELGFVDGLALNESALSGHFFSKTFGIHPWSSVNTENAVTAMNCNGTEKRLADCTRQSGVIGCGVESGASVICFNTTVDNINNETVVRLADGGDSWGRVEVRHLGIWGQVCTADWTDRESSVVCRMLGYTGGKAFGETSKGNLPNWISEMTCLGNETSLLDCQLGKWGSSQFTCVNAHVLCYNVSVDLQLEDSVTGSGRVDIIYDGVPGTICNDGWTEAEAGLICKMLGFTDGRPMDVGVTPGSGPVYLSDLTCGVFDEDTSIFQCDNAGWRRSKPECQQHENDAGVRCYRNVRLSSGTHSVGVVQIYSSGRWKAVCGREGFDDAAARVTCKELGFQNGTVLPLAVFSDQHITTVRPNVSCTGDENSLLNCSYDTSISASCLPFGVSYASVACYDEFITPSDKYKLEGGNIDSQQGSGRVRVYKYQTVGYICDKFWGDQDANVLCKELKFKGGISYIYKGYIQGPYFINEINCAGNETQLEDCPAGQEICSPTQAAGVLCYSTQAPRLELKPHGGQLGRLEVVVDDEAGRICADRWNNINAAVACTQLGFNDGVALMYPKGQGDAFMADVKCYGNEANLFQCFNAGWKVIFSEEACSPYDAGALCFKDVRVTQGSVNQSMAMGKLSMLVDGRWLMVCADSFDQAAAAIACKNMGFTRYKVLRTSKATYNPNYVIDLACVGNETSLTGCSYRTGQCPYSVGQARVLCFSDTQAPETQYNLIGGYHGRVMVERYGLNGTICEEGWDDKDAMVLCKQLGYAGGVALGTPRNSSYELVWYSSLNCTGDENTLESCVKNETVSIACRNSPTSAGALCYKTTGVQLRLADGGKNFGRVEIAYDGVWGTVCDYVWSRYDARALCRQLGYVEGIAYAQSRYGRGSGPVYLDEMRCRVDDKNIFACPNRGWNNSAGYCHDHDNDAGVYCFPRVRLEPNDTYGGLEVWTGYSYALVCAEGFTHVEAKVACRQLGFLDGRAICCSAFGDLRKAIAMAEVKCTGNEASIMDCDHTMTYPLCSSDKYASVVCTNVTDNTDAYIVRLEMGTYGRVILKHLNHDGLVCPNGFDDKDVQVLCNEMGMSNGGISYKRLNNRQRLVKDLRWMTNIRCTGNEYLLHQCPGADWYNVSTCDPTTDAAALCYLTPGVSPPTFRIEGGTRLEGRVEVNINGIWGSICGLDLDDNVATIICKALNYPSGRAGRAGTRGQSTGPVWINQIRCKGNESSIFDCPLTGMGEEDPMCKTHLYDAVIMCHSTVRLAGDINGRTDYGRVEVNVKDKWLPVCDGGFNNNAVEVACRQMGYNYGKRQCCSALGPLSLGSPNITRVTCQGHEERIANCSVLTAGTCSSGNYVSAVCSTEELQENLAIALPNNGFLGMVNVSRFGIWGAICHEDWNDTEANAACQQLGFLGGVSIPGTKLQTGMPILMGGVTCEEGNNFTDCTHDEFDDDHGCSDSRRGAAALCSNSAEGIRYRLAPGSEHDKGLAQVNVNGDWGYISRLDFNDDDASVFCRSIGRVAGQVLWRSVPSSISGDIIVSSVGCTGSEPALHHCLADWDPERNKHIPTSFAVSVTCFKGVRIERGDSKTNGIVKAYNNGVWGTMCGENFGDTEATVVCRELGMTAGIALCCSPFGFNFDDAVMANLQCTGSEKAIRDCQFNSRNGRRPLCYRQYYASVACYNGTRSDNFTLSLAGGSTYTGQVAITYSGVEGRVCSDSWDDKDAQVVCKQLGYTNGTAYTHYRSGFSYYEYSGPYWLSQVKCTGEEAALKDCPHIGLGNVTSCAKGHYAGALCYNKQGLFYRLSAGGTQWGRVEVAVDGQWGTLCDRYWDRREARVFCKNLGFDDGDPFYGKYLNNATGPVWESNLRCTGYEKTLNECPHEGWAMSTSRTCSEHKRDAGVFCYTRVKLSTGVGRSINHGGVLWNQGGTWRHVCDVGFNDMSARIVCQSLGFVEGRSICCSAYGAEDIQSGEILQNMTLRCNGEETSVTQCVMEEGCDSKLYASVVCSDDPKQFENDSYNITISRTGRDSGQLSVSHYGVKGRVCSKNWDDQDAAVICKKNGYDNGIAYQHSYYGTYATKSQLGPFWLSSINCTGDEDTLLNCSYLDRKKLGNCTDKHTASALCYSDEGIAYRLAGGGAYYGRAEIRIGGVWGTICDNYWDAKEANVFCRTLNYSDGVALSRAHYGEGTGPIWLSHLQCTGKEKEFHQCPHRGYKDLYSTPSWGWPFILPCTSHKDDASVFCFKNARLNQRFGATKGGLELFDNGERVGVCDTGLDNDGATVACKSLGLNFTYGRVVGGSVFGNLSGPIRFTSVNCTGDENDISECVLSKAGECTTGTYASVYCSKTPFNDTGFEVRLAEDSLSQHFHGILEVKNNGVWGRVCMQGWDDTDAGVACRTIGFKGGVAYLHIVKNTNAIIMRDFGCNGTEPSLANCTFKVTADMENCHYDANDAGVVCYNGTGVKYRLFGGKTSSTGRVEIGYDGEWGTVCSWAWSTSNAKIFCKSLGQGFVDGLPERTPIANLPHRNYLLNGAFCNGGEQSLLTCLNSGFNTSLLYYLCTGDAYTSCYTTEIALTDIRLRGGLTPDQGRVEVYISGPNEWGTICDDYWDTLDADVICRQLGYEHGRAFNKSRFGNGEGRIWLDNVECIGNETSIADCKNRGIGTHNCNHSEDASVECYNVTTPTVVTSPSTTSTTVSTTPSTTSTTTTTPSTTPPSTTPPSTTTKSTTTTTTPTSTTSSTTTPTTTTTTTTTPTTVTTTTTSPTTPTTPVTTQPTPGTTEGARSTPMSDIVVAVVVPIILLILIIVVVAVVLWRMRRQSKAGISHERFHDDIIEQTHDGSIAMRNQLYDMNMANGDTSDPLSDMKYLAEDSEISIEGNGYAHFSKSPAQSTDDSGGFSNPLYSVMKDPSNSEPAELQLDVDLKESKT